MSFGLRLAALALALVGAVQAGPLVQIKAAKGPVVPNGYIVTLKPSASLAAHRDILRTFKRDESDVKYEWASLHAFAGTFSDDALLALRQSDDVAAIEPDAVGGVDALVTQTDAIWNLQRISQAAKLASTNTTARNYTYTYDDSAGEGVDIYVVDSGMCLLGRLRYGGGRFWVLTSPFAWFQASTSTTPSSRGAHLGGRYAADAL